MSFYIGLESVAWAECETHFVIVAGLSESGAFACPADRGGEWGTTMKRVSQGL